MGDGDGGYGGESDGGDDHDGGYSGAPPVLVMVILMVVTCVGSAQTEKEQAVTELILFLKSNGVNDNDCDYNDGGGGAGGCGGGDHSLFSVEHQAGCSSTGLCQQGNGVDHHKHQQARPGW